MTRKKISLTDIPDAVGAEFPERCSFAISKETHKRIEELEKMGKKLPNFFRLAIDTALDEVLPAKKTG